MSKGTVLSHVFQHDGTWHFFDAVTNDLYECDEVVAAVVHDLNGLEDEAVRARLDARWGADKVATALAEIAQLRDECQALTPVDLKIIERCACCSDPQGYEDSIGQLQLTITEQCNLRCRYCPYTTGRAGSRVHNEAVMSGQILREAIDFFMARNAKKQRPAVSFYGGEPLLAFDLVKEGIAHIRRLQGERDVLINIDTNGTLIDDDVARYLIDQRVHVQISLDGPQELHDRYRLFRDGTGTHEAVVAGLRRLLRLDPEAHLRIRFNAVVAPPYALKRVVDYFADFPIYQEFGIAKQPVVTISYADLTNVQFKQAEPSDTSTTGAQTDHLDIRQRFFAACRDGQHAQLPPAVQNFYSKRLAQYHFRGRDPLGEELFPTGSCQPGKRKLHVRADGSMLPCERGGDNMFIGHVSRGFDMNRIHALYKKLIGAVAQRCPTCWAVRHCTVCFINMGASWESEGGDDVVIPAARCEEVRRAIAATFRDWLDLKKMGPAASEWLKYVVLE